MPTNYEEYLLFLDESSMNNFCAVGGIIVKKDDCINLENKIKDLKKILWGEEYFENNQENCILHATDLNGWKINCSNKKYRVGNKPYLKEIKSENIEKFYNKLAQFIRENNIIPIFSIVDENLLKAYYGIENLKKLDLQLFCFENIMQTYIHFLEKSNGIGFTIYEAQNGESNLESSPDHKIINNFFEIKINNKGVCIFPSKTTRNRLRYIDIIKKKDNNNLLQLADLILFAYLKWLTQNSSDNDQLAKEIYTKLYNGNQDPRILDIREFWGAKMFPYNISKIKDLAKEKQKLSNALHKIKNSLKKIERKNKTLIAENSRLKQQIESLKEKNDEIIS